MKSVISLLQAAETQVAASYGSSRPEIRDEKELPITEIREELDEEGNIICRYTIRLLSALQLTAL